MNENEIEVGDVVVLNSGGPDMTAVEVTNVIMCAWFDHDHHHHTGCFPATGLSKIGEHGEDEPAIPAGRTYLAYKDERLANVDNNKLHEMYEALRDKAIGFTREIITPEGEVVALTRNAIDDELTARGDGPIPF